MKKIPLSCRYLEIVNSQYNETILIAKKFPSPKQETVQVFLKNILNSEINPKKSRGIYERKLGRKFD